MQSSIVEISRKLGNQQHLGNDEGWMMNDKLQEPPDTIHIAVIFAVHHSSSIIHPFCCAAARFIVRRLFVRISRGRAPRHFLCER